MKEVRSVATIPASLLELNDCGIELSGRIEGNSPKDAITLHVREQFTGVVKAGCRCLVTTAAHLPVANYRVHLCQIVAQCLIVWIEGIRLLELLQGLLVLAFLEKLKGIIIQQEGVIGACSCDKKQK